MSFHLSFRTAAAISVMVGGLLGPGGSWAADSDCHAIRNADQRNLCLALVKRQDSYCHAIGEADSRNHCLAVVRRQDSYCHAIREQDARSFCLGLVRP